MRRPPRGPDGPRTTVNDSSSPAVVSGATTPYDEDRSQVCTAAAPHVMATLRNTAITVLRRVANIAVGLRHHSRDPERAIPCLLTC